MLCKTKSKGQSTRASNAEGRSPPQRLSSQPLHPTTTGCRGMALTGKAFRQKLTVGAKKGSSLSHVHLSDGSRSHPGPA